MPAAPDAPAARRAPPSAAIVADIVDAADAADAADAPNAPDAPDATAACAHCGLPVRLSRRARSAAAAVAAAAAHAAADADVNAASAAAATAPMYCCVGCRLAAAAGGSGGARGLLEARLLLSAFLAMGVMTFSLVSYGETLHAVGDEPGLAAVRNLGRAALALFSTPVLLLLGLPLLAGAWADLSQRRVRMDGLIVLATFAAFGLSLAHTWTGEGEVYYDTATMVLVLVSFGRRLEAHARAQGRDAATALAECLPRAAHRMARAGYDTAPAIAMPEDVAPEVLSAGDLCELRPGEAVPADVIVVAGGGAVRCAHITGEETPRPVGPGDELPAGALNGETALTVRVLRPVAQSRLARLRELLDAPLPATHLTRLVDRLAGVLAALSITLAAVAGSWFAWHAGAGDGLRVALSVLLVACPCALGLATPLAYRALRTALAKRGLLVHDAAALERCARVDTVLLDKTGTLTDPALARAQITAETPAAVLRLARLVSASGHALASAFAMAAPGSTAAPDTTAAPGATAASDVAAAPGASLSHAASELVDDLRLVPGRGVRARIGGRDCCAGSLSWLESEGVQAGAPFVAERDRLLARGVSIVALAEEGVITALAGIESTLRPGAHAAVADFRRRGLAVLILSGDRQASAASLGSEVGAAALGDLLPEGKLAVLQDARCAGRVTLMAGDGINDAPALRAADVGVALAVGSAAARGQAGVELVADDLHALVDLLDAARALRRAVRVNLTWTLIYNAVLLALAASGHLHPLLAAVAMIVSSLMVSLRSYALLTWEPPVRNSLSSARAGHDDVDAGEAIPAAGLMR